jgi:hypothetical protein
VKRQCCHGGPAWRRLAQRLYGAMASMLPAAALVLLPKCPMCLAAWLTALTGFGFSAGMAGWLRGGLVMLSVAIAALAMAPITGAEKHRQ